MSSLIDESKVPLAKPSFVTSALLAGFVIMTGEVGVVAFVGLADGPAIFCVVSPARAARLGSSARSVSTGR